MKTIKVTFYNKGNPVFGTEYKTEDDITQSDLLEMAEDSKSRNSNIFDKCGIEDERGILLQILNSRMEKVKRINPNEDYWKILTY